VNPDNEQNLNLTFSVTAEEAGQRLDAFLATRIESWSRARLQRLIGDADVVVNGNAAKASYKVRGNDEIDVELTPQPSDTFTPEDIPIEVVYEDNELIVVNKPAGMVVHPAAGISGGTLANAVAFHFAQLSKVGTTRPGIVHRLDKGTSGLLVVAKTESAHEHLANQFRDREVFKSYIALVHGQVEQSKGEINQPIARDPRNRVRMAIVRGGRPAISIYRVRKSLGRFTLLDVELKTGRTHQIRVHLASIKHPVIGDEVYGGGRDKTIVDPEVKRAVAKINRQFLHAAELGFRHPATGEPLKFTAVMPPELQSVYELIRSKTSNR
jgi:23S rRNA pseudouridine1911/1915/1917 synthase